MKINVTIDCTPQEARSFFGLPDVAPLQERLLNETEERFRASLAALDAESLMKTFIAGSNAGLERWQEMFTGMVRSGMTAGDKKD